MRFLLIHLPRQLLSGLLILLLLDGCAGVPYRPCPPGAPRCAERSGIGGSGPPEPAEAWSAPAPQAPPWWAAADEQARKDESSLVEELAWNAASQVDAEGALLRIGLSASGGALTPDYLEAFPPTGRRGTSGERSFRAALRGKLELFTGTRRRYVLLTFQRGSTSWWLSSFQADEVSEAPAEARSLPVRQAHLPEASRQATQVLAAGYARPLRAPAQAGAELKAVVRLVDDRAVDISTVSAEPRGKVTSEAPEPTLPWEMANAIDLFLLGVGDREVDLWLRAQVRPGETRPRWCVTWAQTRHPRPPELEEFGTSFAEYKLLREEWLREWREQSIECARAGAVFTAREVAIWVIGGMALHGVGTVAELAMARFWRSLVRMGPGAADWLECLLVRIPKAERAPLQRLVGRVQEVGARGLTAAERGELRGVLDRYMEAAARPLSIAEKKELREIARRRFWEALHPELAEVLVDALKQPYPIHHEIPLEYAQLFPELDINAANNLVAVAKDVHDSIGEIWTMVRGKKDLITAADARKVASIIHEHYKPFLNTVYNPARSAARLRVTKAAAIAEVNILLNSL